jgi:cellulose synthase (UDP-forming)
MIENPDIKSRRPVISSSRVSRRLLSLNCLMAVVYFYVLAFGFRPSNHVLFYLLIIGEAFHLVQIFGYCFTIWNSRARYKFDYKFSRPVDVFITVCGEPVSIVRETVEAVLAMNYPDFNVYILNDGFVAKKSNWKAIESLAKELKVNCITRTRPGGAKAGNINNGLSVTESPYFLIFDADHAPHVDFLSKTMGFFVDPRIGFVQTPQYYKNHGTNLVTQAAWSQQTIFFGPIMCGKNHLNSAFMCGTNMVLSRLAIEEAGGMCEFNIAEDFLTSLFVHEKGWKSIYVSEVLAEGLAPEDFLSYYKQQYRWARGSLEVIFKYNPMFRKGLSASQRLQYLISASYFLSGLVVVYDAVLPLIFLYFGAVAVNNSTMVLAIIFLPYIFLTFATLQLSNNFSLTFYAISFSLSCFYLQLKAIASVMFGKKASFSVTSKQQLKGNFAYMVAPQIIYVVLAIIGSVVGFVRDGLGPSYLANMTWVAVNVAIFVPFIKAASPTGNPLIELLKHALGASSTKNKPVQEIQKIKESTNA